MKVLIYEFISGGGFADAPVSAGVLSEGFSMLRSLVSDFKAAGHQVTTVLDPRIATLNPPLNADCIIPVFSSQEVRQVIRKSASSADASYVVAPESEGLLQSLLELVEETGVASLNCAASAVEKVADKGVLYECLSKMAVSTPKTIVLSTDDDVEEITRAVKDQLRFPLIVKPSSDVSCGGLSVARNERHMAGAVDKIKRESSNKRFLVQEFIDGVAASVSLIFTGSEALPISLNCQYIALGAPDAVSSYLGGLTPFNHPLRPKAFAIAEKIVKSFKGLKGYVGVDLVLTEEEALAIEVNPRLTTSYVGLRRVVNFNPAEAIMNAVLQRQLPIDVQTCGYALFSKVETPPPPTLDALQKTYAISEVVAPPFPISSSETACALISSHGATLKAVKSRFRAAKQRVLKAASAGEQ